MFEAASAAAFAALFAIWKREDWLNAALKLTFLAMAIWGGIEALLAWGFILAPTNP